MGGGGAAASADETRASVKVLGHPIGIALRFIVREEFPAGGFLRLAQVGVEPVGQAVGERNEAGIDFRHDFGGGAVEQQAAQGRTGRRTQLWHDLL